MDYGFGFVFSEQAVVDEDAREPVADRFGHEHGRDRRVHAAGQAADRGAITDLTANRLDALLHEGPGRPVGGATSDLEQERPKHLDAARRVRDLGMELHPEDVPLEVRDRRKRAVGGSRDRLETRGQALHAIAVAHPHVDVRAHLKPVKKPLGLEHLEPRRTVLPLICLLDLAAEKMTGELHPVADAQDRNPKVKHPRIDARAPLGKHTRRPATQNDRLEARGLRISASE